METVVSSAQNSTLGVSHSIVLQWGGGLTPLIEGHHLEHHLAARLNGKSFTASTGWTVTILSRTILLTKSL